MTPRPRTLPDLLSGDDKTNGVFRKWKVFLDGILACPLLYGVLVSGEVPDFDGTTTLRHNLGRLPVGWFIVDTTTDGVVIYRTEWDDTTITFGRPVVGASVDAPFTVWVF